MTSDAREATILEMASAVNGWQARAATPSGAETVALRRRHRRLWPNVLSATSVYLLFVLPRLHTSGALWFVHLGSRFLHASNTSPSLSPALGATSQIGYDGQYYFAVAIDPLHAHNYIQPSVSAGYVYSRAFYPMLARLLGLGRIEGVAYALLLINLLSVIVATLAIGSWLRRRGVSPHYALLYALFPGLVFAVFRDLTEPLAYGLVAGAVWLLDSRTTRAVGAAAALMALSMLTRETTGVFAIVLAVSLVAGDRKARSGLRAFRRGVLFLIASALPLLVWRMLIALWLSGGTQERPGGGLGYLIPFHAYAAWWPWQPMRTLSVMTLAVPAVIAAVASVAAWRSASERWPFALFMANAAIFIAYLPVPVLIDYGAAGRSALGPELALIYCLPALLRRRARGRGLAFLCSPVWYVIVAAVLGWPGPYPIS